MVTRRRATSVAGHQGDLASALAALDDPDAGVRAIALGALRRNRALDATTLQRGLADPHPVVRRRACEETVAVAAQRPRDATGWVVARLGDDDPTVVEAACYALGEVLGGAGSSEPTPPDGPARPDDEPAPATVTLAVGALCRVAEKHADALCREAAVAALGAIGDERGVATILTATTDKPAVRRRAVLALAPFDGPNVDAGAGPGPGRPGLASPPSGGGPHRRGLAFPNPACPADLHEQPLTYMNRSRTASNSSRHFPAPSTTHSSGASTMCTGRDVSSAIR